MATFSNDPKNEADFALYKEAQSIFKASIEAIMKGDKEAFMSICTSFLSRNIHVRALDFFSEFKSEGKTLLHVAASSGHTHMVQAIFDRCEAGDHKTLCGLRDDNGFTPLMNATVSESLPLMMFLVQQGADVNAQNKDGVAAIHFAASDGSLERMEYLVDKGAKVDLPSGGGTPLHWAAGAKNGAAAVSFIAARCNDLNAVNAHGATAVLAAAAAGYDDTVGALVNAGCDIGAIYSGNLTLLHICAENGLINAVRAIAATPTGSKCLSIETEDGNWPIHLAAMVRNREVVAHLLPLYTQSGLMDAQKSTIESLMEDGTIRMQAWNKKHGDNNEAKDKTDGSSSSTADLSAINMGPAADEASAREAEALKATGNEHYKLKEYEQAIAAYTRALEKQGDNKAVWSNRSACFMSIKDHQSALRDAEVCRHLDPSWVKGCYRLAAARLALGLYEDAAVAAFEGCKLDEGNAELKALMQKAVRLGQQAEKEKRERLEKGR